MSAAAQDIVEAILDNLRGRKGVGNELESIEPDVYAELENSLVEIVDKRLHAYVKGPRR